MRRYDLGDRISYPHHPPLFQTYKRARLVRGVDLGRQDPGNSLECADNHYCYSRAKCGTVVPQQVDLFVRWEVWRHTEVGYTRNRTLGVNVEDNLRVPPRSQDGLEGL